MCWHVIPDVCHKMLVTLLPCLLVCTNLVFGRASVEAATANLTRGGTRPTAESADELQMI